VLRTKRVEQLGKVEIREINSQANYATDESILEFLHTVAARDGLPVFDSLSKLSEGIVDSISLAKDHPYKYFFARSAGNNVSIIVKDEQRTVEMQLTLPALREICP